MATIARTNRPLASLLALALLAAACSQQTAAPPEPGSLLVAEVASFDVSLERTERFIVGLFAIDRGDVSLGSVQFSFDYFGDLDGSSPQDVIDAVERPPDITAHFLPIPGSEQVEGDNPTFDPPEGARGVYGTEPIRFPESGVWEVTVTAPVDGETLSASGVFEVFETSTVPGPGDPAPPSNQPLPGDASVPPEAIDSLLSFEDELTDPNLHRLTVADALEAARPTMVVVATPAFCVSRFCGPITDELSKLESTYGDRVEFVHLEVWQDFEARVLNPAAAEWVAPEGVQNAAEPWVFLIDETGAITARWDNVASAPELTVALEALLDS